jgi:hypothetical protein
VTAVEDAYYALFDGRIPPHLRAWWHQIHVPCVLCPAMCGMQLPNMSNCSVMPCDDGLQISTDFVNLAQAECAAAMASVPELPEESGGVRSPRLSLDRLACRQRAPQSPTCR